MTNHLDLRIRMKLAELDEERAHYEECSANAHRYPDYADYLNRYFAQVVDGRHTSGRRYGDMPFSLKFYRSTLESLAATKSLLDNPKFAAQKERLQRSRALDEFHLLIEK